MSEPFLSSDDYDERAHQLYNDGQYDHAIETLREGLGLYPHAVELHVGMGYARLAREEYPWAPSASRTREARCTGCAEPWSWTRDTPKPASISPTCCTIGESTRRRCFTSSAPSRGTTSTGSPSGG